MVQDILAKCSTYKDAKAVKDLGIYPYFRKIEYTDGRTVVVGGKRLVMVGSNNYLGLTHDPRVLLKAKLALDTFGTGCTGSRLLNGNLSLHHELEERLAAFLGKAACLVFSTGFLANQGAISTLVGRHDVVYSDNENHASIIEGTRVALGDKINFRHNNMSDLERVLINTREKYKGAVIIADGVFSMSGQIFDLPGARALADKYNCRLFIDDAHAMGVLGPRGEGTEHHFGCVGAADIVMGTFSKSFASMGGVIASSTEFIEWLKHKSRAFIFTAAMPPPAVATVLACLDIMEQEPEHRENLWNNARFMQTELQAMGFDTLNCQTPIVPVRIGDDLTAFAFTQRLMGEGVFATPVVQPAVAKNHAMIRTSYMATHTQEDLEITLEAFYKLGKEFDIIDGNKRAVA